MTDYELLQRLAYLQKTLKKLKELGASAFDEFNSDFRVSDAALYNLEVATETVVDLANRVITKRGGSHPRNRTETFRTLGTLGVIDKPVEMGLLKLALLRNTRANSYVDVNLQELYILLRNELPIISKAVKILRKELGMEEKR
ncbi:MAG: hypothetical protein C4K49_12455 [Candidatus Thorarchaeota archaeon]|nr:MAG: hypothetical protein C4K49_12455 [Candidatus Thorarchaeota archaeon]